MKRDSSFQNFHQHDSLNRKNNQKQLLAKSTIFRKVSITKKSLTDLDWLFTKNKFSVYLVITEPGSPRRLTCWQESSSPMKETLVFSDWTITPKWPKLDKKSESAFKLTFYMKDLLSESILSFLQGSKDSQVKSSTIKLTKSWKSVVFRRKSTKDHKLYQEETRGNFVWPVLPLVTVSSYFWMNLRRGWTLIPEDLFGVWLNS